jgi:hypothetical protein
MTPHTRTQHTPLIRSPPSCRDTGMHATQTHPAHTNTPPNHHPPSPSRRATHTRRVFEARFELESATQTADRLRKRLAEVTAFATIANRGKPIGDAAASAATSLLHVPPPPAPLAAAGRTGASKREADLEDLVTALRRVIEKQKADLDKARAAAPTSAATASTARAAIADGDATLRTQVSTAWGEVAKLKERLAAAEAAAAASAGSGGASADALRRALKVAETEIRGLRARPAAALTDETAATAMQDLRGRLAQATAAAANAAAEAAALRRTNEQLQAQALAASRAAGIGAPTGAERRALAKVNEAATAARDRAANAARTADALVEIDTDKSELAARVSALERENADLRGELDAFDIEFFEEIEDLKHRYAEATRKCKAFDEYVRTLGTRALRRL